MTYALPRGPRRSFTVSACLAALALLAACAAPPPAPPLLHLPLALPGPATPPMQPDCPASVGDWHLMTPIALPAALDREAVMVATAPGQWVPWQGLRWSEPLRDALPRLLAADLGSLRGAPVWAGRAAPGITALHELRIDIDDWEASLPQAQVRLQARWALSAPDGRSATQRGAVTVRQPWPTATPSGLVLAQRAALQALAAAVVTQTGGGCPRPA